MFTPRTPSKPSKIKEPGPFNFQTFQVVLVLWLFWSLEDPGKRMFSQMVSKPCSNARPKGSETKQRARPKGFVFFSRPKGSTAVSSRFLQSRGGSFALKRFASSNRGKVVSSWWCFLLQVGEAAWKVKPFESVTRSYERWPLLVGWPVYDLL